MQWSLFLLILMGQSSFFTCHRYEYHFIQEQMNWTDAQKYCREHYTDLATVFDMNDMSRLCEAAKNQHDAWIGLYSKPKPLENWRWHWSLPGVEYELNETVRNSGDCVLMKNHTRCDESCGKEHNFICYDEKYTTNTFYFGKDNKTWPEAQSYCREHHTDLVSGLKQLEDKKLTSKMDENTKYWIGLFKDNWWWSDESGSSFRHWEHEFAPTVEDASKCAMTMLGEEGRWKHCDCNEEKPFICYDDKMILIKENKTWVEALYYCREKHYDLVSITNRHQQIWVQNRIKNANSDFVWLGLRYTCTLDFWFWVSDERVSYTNWASGGRNDSCDMSAAMESGGDHKWYTMSDNKRFNFLCTLE